MIRKVLLHARLPNKVFVVLKIFERVDLGDGGRVLNLRFFERFKLWHRRADHLSFYKLGHLFEHRIFLGVIYDAGQALRVHQEFSFVLPNLSVPKSAR